MSIDGGDGEGEPEERTRRVSSSTSLCCGRGREHSPLLVATVSFGSDLDEGVEGDADVRELVLRVTEEVSVPGGKKEGEVSFVRLPPASFGRG